VQFSPSVGVTVEPIPFNLFSQSCLPPPPMQARADVDKIPLELLRARFFFLFFNC